MSGWKDRGSCRSVDPEIFFALDKPTIARAKDVCASCPVTRECLQYGLAEPDGIWGGRTFQERENLVSLFKRIEAAGF